MVEFNGDPLLLYPNILGQIWRKESDKDGRSKSSIKKKEKKKFRLILLHGTNGGLERRLYRKEGVYVASLCSIAPPLRGSHQDCLLLKIVGGVSRRLLCKQSGALRISYTSRSTKFGPQENITDSWHPIVLFSVLARFWGTTPFQWSTTTLKDLFYLTVSLANFQNRLTLLEPQNIYLLTVKLFSRLEELKKKSKRKKRTIYLYLTNYFPLSEMFTRATCCMKHLQVLNAWSEGIHKLHWSSELVAYCFYHHAALG